MQSAYELLGVGPDVSRAELDAAYKAKYEAYDPARVAHLGPEFEQIANQHRAAYTAAYQELRTAIGGLRRLPPGTERRRDLETLIAAAVLVALALLVPLVRDIGAPVRTVSASGADTAAITSQAAPDFTLETLDGETVTLSELKGKVVLINFWATWCPPCVREVPRLVRVADKYRDQGLVVLGVNTTFQDDPVKVAQFTRDQGITYPVLLDMNDDAGKLYPARLMPTTYFVDHTGRVVHAKVGEVSEATIEEQVQQLLAARE